MIIRETHAVVQPGQHAAYEQYVRERIVPLMRAEPGLMYLHFGTPLQDEPDEYVMVSVWDDLEAVHAFAGPDWNKPVLRQGEQGLLQSVRVRHYDALPIEPPAPRSLLSLAPQFVLERLQERLQDG